MMMMMVVVVAMENCCDCSKRKNGNSEVYQPKKKYQKAGLFSDTYKLSPL